MLSAFSGWVIPLVVTGVVLYGAWKGVRVFDAFVEGAAEGLRVVLRIAPTMLAIMLCIGVLRASGTLELLSLAVAAPVRALGLPPETMPLMLMRPISGSGALAVFKDIIQSYGPDSHVGRVASVMQGSTETTFYTICVYFAATKVRDTRHTLACSLAGDVTGYLMSAFAVAIFM